MTSFENPSQLKRQLTTPLLLLRACHEKSQLPTHPSRLPSTHARPATSSHITHSIRKIHPMYSHNTLPLFSPSPINPESLQNPTQQAENTSRKISKSQNHKPPKCSTTIKTPINLNKTTQNKTRKKNKTIQEKDRSTITMTSTKYQE